MHTSVPPFSKAIFANLADADEPPKVIFAGGSLVGRAEVIGDSRIVLAGNGGGHLCKTLEDIFELAAGK